MKRRRVGGVWEEHSVPFVLEKIRRRRRLRRRNLELPWRGRDVNVSAMAAPVDILFFSQSFWTNWNMCGNSYARVELDLSVGR